MRSARFAIFLLLLAIAGAEQAVPHHHPTKGGLWRWNHACAHQRAMLFELLQERRLLYSKTFPICRMNEDFASPHKIVEFYFRGGRTFQGEYRTRPSLRIEGNIWQAGKDPDVILLGVSFSTKERILLNTIHFAKVSGESTTELDRGLVVKTSVVMTHIKRRR